MNWTYGDKSGTIHDTTEINIERDPLTGKVVAVWFRCMLLPFADTICSLERASEMTSLYKDVLRTNHGTALGPARHVKGSNVGNLVGVVFEHFPLGDTDE